MFDNRMGSCGLSVGLRKLHKDPRNICENTISEGEFEWWAVQDLNL